MVAARASSTSWELCFRTCVRPSWSQADWSAVRNSTCPLSDLTRCPVMTQDTVQFSGAVFVGSGRASPACYTGRRLTPLPSAPYSNPWDSSDKKVYHSAFYTRPKASPMPGATRCTNPHSCWSDLCSPE